VLPDERSGPWQGRPDDTHTTDFSIATWADNYRDAECWVRWNGRRRWSAFAVNDQIWACSVADWATNGRRAA
jgi:hypothetical protein